MSGSARCQCRRLGLDGSSRPTAPRNDRANNKKATVRSAPWHKKTQQLTVNGQQAHSEKVFCCGCVQQGSIETWNALLSSGFSYKGSLHQEKSSVKMEYHSIQRSKPVLQHIVDVVLP